MVEVRRADKPEMDFVHSLRSLVATDRDGKPSCLALILKDVSDQFEAEERFERTFNANPAPAVITRLSDLRHVKVNTGFLEMTGFTRDAVIGRSVYEVDVLAGARNRDLAVARLESGGTIPQMEACLDLPDGGSRFVIVAGQPIAMGDEPCMLFTFADLELRRKAETALRQSEERFAKAFRMTPVPTVLVRADTFQVTGINEAFSRVFGHGEDRIVGRSLDEAGVGRRQAAPAGRGRPRPARLRPRGRGVPAPRERDEPGLPGLGRARDHQRCRVRPAGPAGHHRAQAHRAGAVRRDRDRDGRHVVVQPRADREARDPAPPRPGGRRGAAPNLTVRERQILNLICSGLGDDAIARKLGLSRNTVRNHGAALYRKIGIHKRSEAVVWGRENGFPLSRPDG